MFNCFWSTSWINEWNWLTCFIGQFLLSAFFLLRCAVSVGRWIDRSIAWMKITICIRLRMYKTKEAKNKIKSVFMHRRSCTVYLITEYWYYMCRVFLSVSVAGVSVQKYTYGFYIYLSYRKSHNNKLTLKLKVHLVNC